MPYADPDQQRAYQREIQRDRSRGVAIYRAALLWCAQRQTEEGRRLLGRLTRMLTAELAWRSAQGAPLPPWSKQQEEELLNFASGRSAGGAGDQERGCAAEREWT
jgi:hypothetical protein